MSEPTDPTIGEGFGYTGEGEAQGTNPAWNEVLQEIPQDLHEKVTPYFQKWDKGVQDRFTKVQSDWAPWKNLKDAGVDPETAQFGVNLARALQDDPRMVFDALREHYKFEANSSVPNNGQGQEEPKSPEEQYAAQFAKIEEQNRRLAEIMLADKQQAQQAQLEAQADAKLDQELSGLKQKYEQTHGPFDESYVLAMMMNGQDAEQAVQGFYSWRDQQVKSYRPRPLIIGSGGNVPGQYSDPKKLSDKDTRNLVAEMLNQANQQG